MSKQILPSNIANRLAVAHQNIRVACEKSLRPVQDVTLMAVSKTKPNASIIDAYHAGQRVFGENYAQELHQKSIDLSELTDIEWHYIGPIQSNKTKIIAESAHWVDSVDRFKVAKRLNQHAIEMNKTLNILLQVNISRSESKSGVMLENVLPLASEITELSNLSFRGLMAIPDNYQDIEKTKAEFLTLRDCFVTLSQQYKSVDTLSLGMSGDMSIAIECGSTMVRIGTAIFGERD
jgi:pyridoxal phosphate enzyme (YggS family)